MSPSPAPEVVTLGCRLNIAESETIRRLLAGQDVAVVNSCAVTNRAVADTRAAIRRVRRARPDARLVVTGCAATIDPAGFAAMPEVDRVVANADKLMPAAWASNVVALTPAPVSAFAGHARGFLDVQTGCDHACTFCIIPQGRGPSRSVPIATAVRRAAVLVAAGHRELVLTGVDLASYRDGDVRLDGLMRAILAGVPALARLRLSSLDPAEIDAQLFDLLTQEPRVMPHVHLSLQSGSDLMLKRMRRRHRRPDAVALVERLKRARPEIAIGADLIAGFPTEDAGAFADTLAMIDDCGIVHAHVFPYSARTGTPAARMPQVAMPERRERAARLRRAAAARRAVWLPSCIGETLDVLVERPGERGHAPDFAEVRLPPAPVGTIVRTRITAATGDHLIGTPA